VSVTNVQKACGSKEKRLTATQSRADGRRFETSGGKRLLLVRKTSRSSNREEVGWGGSESLIRKSQGSLEIVGRGCRSGTRARVEFVRGRTTWGENPIASCPEETVKKKHTIAWRKNFPVEEVAASLMFASGSTKEREGEELARGIDEKEEGDSFWEKLLWGGKMIRLGSRNSNSCNSKKEKHRLRREVRREGRVWLKKGRFGDVGKLSVDRD